MNEIKSNTIYIKQEIGYYIIELGGGGQFVIPLYAKPNFIHKFFMKHLLGVKYRNKNSK